MGDCTLGRVLVRSAYVLDMFWIRFKRGVRMDSLLPIVALASPLEDLRSDTLPFCFVLFVHFQTVPAVELIRTDVKLHLCIIFDSLSDSIC